jgi:hypothetical protein
MCSPVIDVTEPFCAILGSSCSKSVSQPVTNTPDNNDVRRLLLQQLSTKGYALVKIRSDALPETPYDATDPGHAIQYLSTMLQSHCSWKSQLERCFQKRASDGGIQRRGASESDSITYRPFGGESGSATGPVEPKESLEIKRNLTIEHPLTDDDELLQAHMHILSTMVDVIESILQIPPRVLSVPTTPSRRVKAVPTNRIDEESVSCVDLLRAFYYHPVFNNQSSILTPSGLGDHSRSQNEDQPLGSNPHTDWGSWTVVWQDDEEFVDTSDDQQQSDLKRPGCLQVFSPTRKEWYSVVKKPQEHDSNTIRFIVHVGDVTSLVINQLLQQHNCFANKTPPLQNSSRQQCADDRSYYWPSPLHRVVPPLAPCYRCSLVYFAYPPPNLSMSVIQDQLREWYDTVLHKEPVEGHQQPLVVPFEWYYLLRDQSGPVFEAADTSHTIESSHPKTPAPATTSPCMQGNTACDDCFLVDVTGTAERRYYEITKRPLRQVLEEKWAEVQRKAISQ